MSWQQTLLKLAPTVASALGGPLAGAAVVALGEIFGVSEPTQEKIKEIIEGGQMTGEQLSAIKTLELRLKAEEQERGFRYAELEIRDRESARARDSALAHAGIKNYRADSMYFLSVVVICVLVYLTWIDGGINEYVKGIITLVLGRFLGYLDNIYNFEFGTTRGSALKSELLAKASPVKD